LNASRIGHVGYGDRVRADVFVKDTHPDGNGLTVVYADVDFDTSQFRVASVEAADPFNLFADETAIDETGLIRVGGATLDPHVGANTWIRVASVEFEAISSLARPIFNVRPSAGEAVARYGVGLVPTNSVVVVADLGTKLGNRRADYDAK